MLGKHEAVATVAVRDLTAAHQFYGESLGLDKVSGDGAEVNVYTTGSTTLIVYRSQFPGTNKATAVTWSVGADLDAIVHTLSERGVPFEHYDMPDAHLEGDVHVMKGMRAAWFKDPDGNIHGLMSS